MKVITQETLLIFEIENELYLRHQNVFVIVIYTFKFVFLFLLYLNTTWSIITN